MQMHHGGYVYILANSFGNVLYIGVTSDLKKRIYEHRNKLRKGFTSRYQVTKLVYYEIADTIEVALNREKQLKAGNRRRKVLLISRMNPTWMDLYDKI